MRLGEGAPGLDEDTCFLTEDGEETGAKGEETGTKDERCGGGELKEALEQSKKAAVGLSC